MGERIAISGSAGTGKTTLARRAAAVLGVPYLPEGMREYLEGGGAPLHEIGRGGLRDLVLRLWDERRDAEARATGGFVADRASYDFAAFWLYYRFADPADGVSARLLEALLRPDRYDRVVLLPWGVLPLQADGVRSADPFVQLHVQLLVEGAVRRYARRVQVVDDADPDARLRRVVAGG